jgi:hypothetical protein
VNANLVIVACDNCGQKNRTLAAVPAGKKAVCGKCKAPLALTDDDDAVDDAAADDECSFCSGSGELPDGSDCPVCDGAGA